MDFTSVYMIQRNGPILSGVINPEIKDLLLEKNAEERLLSGEIHI